MRPAGSRGGVDLAENGSFFGGREEVGDVVAGGGKGEEAVHDCRSEGSDDVSWSTFCTLLTAVAQELRDRCRTLCPTIDGRCP